LSIRNLCETAVERLKNTYGDPLASNINIPLDEWIRLQFCLANATTMRAMYYTESTLAAADHDFSKLSLIPSVIFFISIPNDISGSFYDRQVFV
ncbi:12835_t:CDS:2, partial [Racocetra persica]